MTCGDTPNCVSTEEVREEYAISPLRYSGTRDEAVVNIKEVLKQMPNITLRHEKEDYLWWECSSQVFGFVDDLEIYFPAAERVIQIRSASRRGYYDFGVNRKRVEKIKQRLMVTINAKQPEE